MMPELRKKLCNLVRTGAMKNTETVHVLIISGSHGNSNLGDSDLTNLDKLRDCNDEEEGDVSLGFNEYDCKSVKPHKS